MDSNRLLIPPPGIVVQVLHCLDSKRLLPDFSPACESEVRAMLLPVETTPLYYKTGSASS
eukprot:scaffold4970_cov91-Isochrysis_galbana.AAC.2